MAFDRLFTPLTLRSVTLRNRIVSTGHNTRIASANVANPALAAYHATRARGGAGLIVCEAATVHETGRHLSIARDSDIDGFTLVADAVHREGGVVFGQLFHPGREMSIASDGTKPLTYAASAVPNDRFHTMPRAMSKRMVREFVARYGEGARRYRAAGMDGVEILASQGYGIGQFLNPRTNLREDRYGGSFTNRLRFLIEIARSIRAAIDDMPLGIRLSGDEINPSGMPLDEVVEICRALDGLNCFDYYNITAGSSATLGAATHIVPPMSMKNGYVVPYAAAVKAVVGKPVVVTGRINQPQIAERILAAGDADLCGMTRAMIADPEMPNKAREGSVDDIRACIGCNQACIGHMHLGYPISCIQHPETGRELRYGGPPPRAVTKRRVLVVGGGPAGLKAAAIAAERGHDVSLHERNRQLGGQVLLAQRLPGRAEFGGIITNLDHEARRAGAQIILGSDVTADLIKREQPDAIILATGARPRIPEIMGAEDAHIVTAWQVLRDEANVGARVIIADWRCDWIGMGIAEKLAREGRHVRLCVNGYMAGQNIQSYVRDIWLGVLHDLRVEIIPMVRLAGVDGETAYFEHVSSDAPIEMGAVETIVLALGHDAETGLEDALADYKGQILLAGDCAAPRTAEEAVLEGLQAGLAV
jgi:2,4-dienoyl-CoA reductase-like NADH-dependent reductase (Old Yellow Enzyme family)